jgi:hypothetical protein
MSRFVDKLDWDSKTDDAYRYITFHINEIISELDPSNENYAFFYTRYKKTLNLAVALLGDYRFEFDTRDDLLTLFNEKATMLNQRAITDAIMAHGHSKAKFLNWVDKYSKFLDKDKTMIHDILDSYVELDVTVPGSKEEAEAAANASTNVVQPGNTDSADSDDFDTIFGTDGEESDTDLFGNTATATQQAARVSAADALNRIKSFDYSL